VFWYSLGSTISRNRAIFTSAFFSQWHWQILFIHSLVTNEIARRFSGKNCICLRYLIGHLDRDTLSLFLEKYLTEVKIGWSVINRTQISTRIRWRVLPMRSHDEQEIGKSRRKINRHVYILRFWRDERARKNCTTHIHHDTIISVVTD